MRRFLYLLFFVLIVCLVQTAEARKLALFGSNVLLVFLLEWDTLLPCITFLPVI